MEMIYGSLHLEGLVMEIFCKNMIDFYFIVDKIPIMIVYYLSKNLAERVWL